MDVLGKALLDELHNGPAPSLQIYTSLDTEEELAPSYFFRTYAQMPELERLALDMATGPVLDIGCGAGSHCLYLQDRGLECLGLDLSPGAVQVASERGVRHTRCENIWDFKSGLYSTLLLLMNGAGISGSLARLPALLRHLGGLLAPGGQILLDSSDLIYLFDQDSDGGVWVPGDRAYYGEVRYSWLYRGKKGKPFPWLFVDYPNLAAAAARAGLVAEKVADGPHYDYLARLVRPVYQEPDKNV
jgi:SAM-dependent methyltransferase